MPSCALSTYFGLFLLCFVCGDAQRPKEPAVVRGHVHRPAGGDDFGRSGNFCNGPALVIRAVHEPDDGFQGDTHFETGRARFFAARFHLRIIGDCSGNGIGKLTSQPVDDVIH